MNWTQLWKKDKPQLILLIIFAVTFFSVCSSSCIATSGLKSVKIVKHPDSPFLIVDAKGDRVQIAIESNDEKKLIVWGWVRVSDLKGWTCTKYNWKIDIERDK